MNGLNDIVYYGLDNREHTRLYKGRPVGNSPELMPWDSSLNKDVHDSFNLHQAYTSNLLKDDIRKFSLATISFMNDGYRRILDNTLDPNEGVPCSWRIIEDVTPLNFPLIFEK